jgi:FlaA1/EpsC-like NDP-sugar epimerase
VEAVNTNVLGTLNVIDAASSVGTERFVFVSTDKAVRPVSVMGATKQLGERLLLAYAPKGVSYCAVRFGNVLGSRGSVIPTFQRQIASGGPVTVTDPHMMRFFMSVEEAVRLVLQASVMADRGDIFVLEMGEPVRILDLARRMIRLSGFNPGTDIPIHIVGMRPGERLHEELHSGDEELSTTQHPSIKRLVRRPVHMSSDRLGIGIETLSDAVRGRDDMMARRVLFDLISDLEGVDAQASPNGVDLLSALSSFEEEEVPA